MLYISCIHSNETVFLKDYGAMHNSMQDYLKCKYTTLQEECKTISTPGPKMTEYEL